MKNYVEKVEKLIQSINYQNNDFVCLKSKRNREITNVTEIVFIPLVQDYEKIINSDYVLLLFEKTGKKIPVKNTTIEVHNNLSDEVLFEPPKINIQQFDVDVKPLPKLLSQYLKEKLQSTPLYNSGGVNVDMIDEYVKKGVDPNLIIKSIEENPNGGWANKLNDNNFILLSKFQDSSADKNIVLTLDDLLQLVVNWNKEYSIDPSGGNAAGIIYNFNNILTLFYATTADFIKIYNVDTNQWKFYPKGNTVNLYEVVQKNILSSIIPNFHLIFQQKSNSVQPKQDTKVNNNLNLSVDDALQIAVKESVTFQFEDDDSNNVPLIVEDFEITLNSRLIDLSEYIDSRVYVFDQTYFLNSQIKNKVIFTPTSGLSTQFYKYFGYLHRVIEHHIPIANQSIKNLHDLVFKNDDFNISKEEQVICSAPWLSLYYSQNSARVCCANKVEIQGSPSDFLSSEFIKNLKQDLLEGKRPSSCSDCWRLEDQGYSSIRTMVYSKYPLKKENLSVNTNIGTKFLEFRASNTCNFSCRMCGPNDSSSIVNVVENNNELKVWYQLTDSMKAHNHTTDANYNEILNLLSNLNKLNLAGGEPMLIKTNYDLLDYIISKQYDKNIELMFTTNCSTVNPYILDKLKQFKYLHLTFSIDATGEIAEYQREGTIWTQVEKNVYSMIELPNVEVVVNTALSAYTILGIENLARFLANLFKRKLEIFFAIRAVDGPTYLNPRVLPPELKTRALLQLQNALKIFEEVPDHNGFKFKELCRFLIKNLEQDSDPENFKRFVQFTKDTDKAYNKSFNKLFDYPLYLP
jgi:MoaA/NifB/PqqE/SkfB family radical SAM enzyme